MLSNISRQFHTVSGGIHLSCLELLDMKHCVPTPLIGLIFSSWATFRSKEEALFLSILMDSLNCNEALYKEIKSKDKRLKGKKVLENEKQFLLRQKKKNMKFSTKTKEHRSNLFQSYFNG